MRLLPRISKEALSTRGDGHLGGGGYQRGKGKFVYYCSGDYVKLAFP